MSNQIENDPKLIRTDFKSQEIWKKVEYQLKNPINEDGFKPYINIVDNEEYANWSTQELKLMLHSNSYVHSFFFIVDSITINHSENPILCISLEEDVEVDQFRVIPQEMWIIENNLSTANLLFEELLDSVDEKGIHRE